MLFIADEKSEHFLSEDRIVEIIDSMNPRQEQEDAPGVLLVDLASCGCGDFGLDINLKNRTVNVLSENLATFFITEKAVETILSHAEKAIA